MSGYDGIPDCGCRNTTHDPTCSLGGSVTAVGHTTIIPARIFCAAHGVENCGCFVPLQPEVEAVIRLTRERDAARAEADDPRWQRIYENNLLAAQEREERLALDLATERQAHRLALERAYRAGWERYHAQIGGGASWWGDAEEGAAAAWANGERP